MTQKLNTIQDIIRLRRSIFPSQYNDEPISETELQQILEAANWAPNHRKTEPWRFKVMQGKSKTKLSAFLGSLYLKHTEKPSKFKHRKIIDKFQQSSCVIAICMQRDPKESVPEWEEIAAVAMAVQNMWLAATDLKIGSYWSSPKLIKHFDQFFDFAEGERCLGLFYMGKTDQEWPKAERKTPIDSKVDYFN
ncbi:MAG: nitroreductase family protein [Psychroflexus salarius]